MDVSRLRSDERRSSATGGCPTSTPCAGIESQSRRSAPSLQSQTAICSSFLWIAYLIVSIDDDPEVARRSAAEGLGRSYQQDFDAMIDSVAVAGTPDQVRVKLQAFVDAGARHLVVGAQHGEQMLTDILPQLRVPEEQS